MNARTHLDLCSGIGGFHLAAEWAGFQTIGFSEVEPYCCKLLAEKWPGIKNYGDLRRADFSGLRGRIDVLSAAVSPVNQHPLPGSEKARTMTVGSGTQCLMLLDLSSPLGAFSRILLASSHWTNSEEFCYVWNRLDTRFALSAFQLTPLGRSTDGSGSLLWRSPTATEDNGGGGANGEDRLAQGHTLRLRDQVKTPTLWPTPQAHDAAKGNPERVGRFGTKHGGRNLTDEVMVPKLWRTPNERDYNGSQSGTGSVGRGSPDEPKRSGQDTETLADADSAERRLAQPGGNEHHGQETGREQSADRHQGGCDPDGRSRFRLTQPPLCRRVDGVPDRSHRLKALGNSVVPQQAYPFFEAIAQVIACHG